MGSLSASLKGTSEIISSLGKKAQLLLAAHRNLKAFNFTLEISATLSGHMSKCAGGSLSEVASSLSLFLMQLSTHLPERGTRDGQHSSG